jgi:hypothetical protein
MTNTERVVSGLIIEGIEHDYTMQGKTPDHNTIALQGQTIAKEFLSIYKNVTAQHVHDLLPLVRRMYSFINFNNMNKAMQTPEWTQLKGDLSKQREPKALPNQSLTDVATPLYTSIAQILFERVRRPFSDFGNMVDYEKYFEDSGVFKMANKVAQDMMSEGADKDTPIKEIDERYLR